MKSEFDSGMRVVLIHPDGIEAIMLAIENAPKTVHKLTKKMKTGDLPTPDFFDPPVAAGTKVGAMFVEAFEDEFYLTNLLPAGSVTFGAE